MYVSHEWFVDSHSSDGWRLSLLSLACIMVNRITLSLRSLSSQGRTDIHTEIGLDAPLRLPKIWTIQSSMLPTISTTSRLAGIGEDTLRDESYELGTRSWVPFITSNSANPRLKFQAQSIGGAGEHWGWSEMIPFKSFSRPIWGILSHDLHQLWEADQPLWQAWESINACTCTLLYLIYCWGDLCVTSVGSSHEFP